MNGIAAMFLAVIVLSGAARATAADENLRTCALTKGFECTKEGGCKELSIEEMALPRFVRIDLKAKTITSLDREIKRQNTKIAGIDRLEGMLVLHGTEKRGWSMALAEDSGELAISASGDGEVFVVFGACVNP